MTRRCYNWSLITAINVSITYPLQITAILSAAIEDGFATGESEIYKDEKIVNNCHDADIICLPYLSKTVCT